MTTTHLRDIIGIRFWRDVAGQYDVPAWLTWVKGASVLAATVWGHLASPFWFLILFVVVDYWSGWMAAKATGTVDSTIGMKGIAKKGLIITIAMSAYLAQWTVATSPAFERILSTDTPLAGLADIVSIGDGFAAMFVWNEWMSIIENGIRAKVVTWAPVVAWFSRRKGQVIA